jgi:hypothetical protein
MRPYRQGIIAILAIITVPALAQTPTPQPVAPSMQGSGAGISGQPGGKSGPALTRDGTASAGINPTTRLQDSTGIQGRPGSKSGPAAKTAPSR